MPETITIEQQIAELKREQAMRRTVYPRFIAQGRMTEADAMERRDRLDAAIKTLGRLREEIFSHGLPPSPDRAERERCARIVEQYPEWIGPQAKKEIAAALRGGEEPASITDRAEVPRLADEAPKDYIVGHSEMRGGWFVYEHASHGEYDALFGPFATQDEAGAALVKLLGVE